MTERCRCHREPPVFCPVHEEHSVRTMPTGEAVKAQCSCQWTAAAPDYHQIGIAIDGHLEEIR